MASQLGEVIDLIKYCRLAYERGLVSGQGGNASVRIPGSNRVYVKSTNTSMGEVNEENLVTVNLQGKKLEGKVDEEPSKEIPFHLAIYRTRDDANSVFHLHPPCATAFAACSAEIPLLTVSAQIKLKKVPLVSFARPGSSELADLVSSEISKHDKSLNSLLLENHGIVTWGKNVADAFYTAELLEETAKIALNARLLGKQSTRVH